MEVLSQIWSARAETQMPGASSGRCWSLSSLGCIVSGRQYRSARAVPDVNIRYDKIILYMN